MMRTSFEGIWRSLPAALWAAGIFFLIFYGRGFEQLIRGILAALSLPGTILYGGFLLGSAGAGVWWFTLIRRQRGTGPALLLASAAAGILGFSASTTFDAPELTHLIQYGVLYTLLRPLGRPLPVLLLTMVTGVADELIQGLHPTRFFDLRDIGLNFSGALLGVILLEPFQHPGAVRPAQPRGNV